MNFTFESLQPYLIAKGSERYCFRHPEKENYLIKLSPENAAKQTEREIKYFQHLKKKLEFRFLIYLISVKSLTYQDM